MRLKCALLESFWSIHEQYGVINYHDRLASRWTTSEDGRGGGKGGEGNEAWLDCNWAGGIGERKEVVICISWC